MARRKGKALAPTTTSPAKMGEEMAHAQSTAAQSPNVKYVPRGGAKGGQDPATAGGRQGVQSVDQHKERLGAKWAPQMLMGSPEVLPSAQETQRNVRIIPSAINRSQFWDKRQYGQVQQ